MKTLNDLFALINEVTLNEANKSYLLKAQIHFSLSPYFAKGGYEKTLVSYSYSLVTSKTTNKRVDILFDLNNIDSELVQHYYWLIKTQCR